MVTDIQSKVACACGRESDVVVAGVGMCNHCLDHNYEKLQKARDRARYRARKPTCRPVDCVPKDYGIMFWSAEWKYVKDAVAREEYDERRDRDYDGMRDNAVRLLEDQ